ncbi:OmpA family protein [Frigidibacter sp. MR17.14]|uniref:OmpA family protein n=1 Tax=Frigidibacter sp. MR17.14 TaxID=3126509 RepID=UPI0030131490
MRFDPKTLGIHWVGGAAFVAAAGLSVVTASWAAGAIEDLSAAAVRSALADEGYTWAQVQADGLSVILTGEAPSEAMRFRALGAAGSVVDASRVVDSMSVPDPAAVAAPDFSVEILRNDEGVSLIGLVPVESGRDAILEQVRKRADGASVTDMLEASDHPAPKDWQAAVDFGVQALGMLPRSKLSISPGHVQVTAITDSIDEKQTLERRLQSAAPKGVALTLDISAPRPVITPFTLRFIIDGSGPHFDACSADTTRARDRILAAGRGAGAPEDSDCTIGMGTPSPAWSEAAGKSIKALAELGAGSVTLSDADVSLIAADSVAQADFDRVAGELDTALPEVFSLTAVLTPKPAAQSGEQGPPQVSAALSEDGKLQIRGRLPDELTRNAVESYAHAHFGSGNVYVATRLDAGVPAGWPVRVLAGLEALDKVHDGRMLVQPDLVRIEGRTGSRETSSQIAQLLSQRLGEGQEFEIRVTYDRKLDASLALPSAQQCVERLAQAQEAEKISFEPGSARLASGSREVMDRLGDILRQCGDYQFEVAGHTDSQGGDAMNLALSEDRAEAVVEGLMTRRVLTANLHPTGYGETKPIADNGSEDGREQNRRIEFTLLTEAPAAATTDGDAAAAADGDAAGAADADAGVTAQAPGNDTRRPRMRPGERAGASAEEVAPSAEAEVADAVDDATGATDEGSGDEMSPEDQGSGDETSGDFGSGDEMDPEDGSGDFGSGDEPGSGDEMGPEGGADGDATEPATTGEAAEGAADGMPDSTAQDPAATAQDATAQNDAGQPAEAQPAAAGSTPLETAAAQPEGVAPAGSPPALVTAPDAQDTAATDEPEVVIEVQTPGRDTVKPPVRPAAIEARAARR